MHVRHRDDRNAADLEAALRAAEAAVEAKLGCTIALTEKPLFDPCSVVVPNGATEAAGSAANTATGDEEVVDSDEEDLEPEERGRRMYARGDGPPSPHPENDAVSRGYDEAASAAAVTVASSSGQGPVPPHGALDAGRGKKRSRDAFPDLETDPMLDAALREAELSGVGGRERADAARPTNCARV